MNTITVKRHSSLPQSTFLLDQALSGPNGRIMDAYTVTQSQIQVASTVMATMTGSTAISGLEICRFVGEHMTITNLFSNTFRKMVNFLIFLQVG
jgi:hypothetical protein